MMVAGEITAPKAAALPFLCSLSLLVVHWLAQYFYSWSLVTHTSEILGLYLVKKEKSISSDCSWNNHDRHVQLGPARSATLFGFWQYFRAVVRGLLGFPIGALVMAFGAIVLGAPVGIRYLTRTVYWSLLMSLFTFVPLTCTFGSSSADWHRILAHFKPEESLDALVSLPAYGSVIGAWIGAWPMPLDWERPWQEWPICVTYGAVAGYLVGALSSMVFVLIHGPVHVKED